MVDFADDRLSLYEFNLEYGRQGETQGDPEKKLLFAILVQAVVDLGQVGSRKFGMRNRLSKLLRQHREDAEQYFRDVRDQRITSLNGIAAFLDLNPDAIRSALLGKFKPLRRCPSCNTSRPPVC